MGDSFGEGYPADGEQPVHAVRVTPFTIDVTTVTMAMFRAFVDDTTCVTVAEREGSSAIFHLAVATERADVIGRPGHPLVAGHTGSRLAPPPRPVHRGAGPPGGARVLGRRHGVLRVGGPPPADRG